MSFFSSLHEYVSNSVAGLTLSPKSRSDSGSGGNGHGSSDGGLGGGGSGTESPSPRGSTDAGAPTGFPRVVPSPGVEALPQSVGRRRSTLEAVPPGGMPNRRPGSFRRQPPTVPPPEPPRPDFCLRRPSWPDVDVQAVSGVHEMDGSYFENIIGVSWEQETRRETARRDFKTSFSEAQPPSTGPSIDGTPDDFLSTKEREQLYVDMLYTIANAVGAPISADGNYKEELYLYGQEAFGISSDHHYRLLHAAGEEKPPIIVLSVVVVEAEGLEAKDANGFSDPYCMLGIQPVTNSPGPQASPSGGNRALSDGSVSGIGGVGPGANHSELRKHHSFRLSFKRRDTTSGGGVGGVSACGGSADSMSSGGRGSTGSVTGVGITGGPVARTHRDSLGSSAQLPAKFIRATSVRPHTLNPRWNEKFRL